MITVERRKKALMDKSLVNGILGYTTEWNNTLVLGFVQTILTEDTTVKYSDTIPE